MPVRLLTLASRLTLSKLFHLVCPILIIGGIILSTLSLSRSDTLKRPRPYSPDDLAAAKRLWTDDDAWLTELHSKIWGQEDRWQELFHTVKITAAQYEKQLTELYPDRHSPDYQAGEDGVLSIKLDVLRSCTVPSIAPAHGLAHPTHPSDEQIEAENNGFEEESNDIDVEAENDDVEEESNGIDVELRSLFPITVDVLDLSSLGLQAPPQCMPLPLLVRQEYKFLSKILEGLPRNGRGSIISGQPGTGMTGCLHLRLIECMIEGCPFLYQTINGTVYHVSETITIVNSCPSNKSIVAFVDTDNTSCEPQRFIRYNKGVQIIAASSP